MRTTATASLLASFTLVSFAACGGATPPANIPAGATSLRLPPPSRNIQLRAAFDKDPSVYIGRFVPDSVAPGDIDENAAVVTRCSRYIKPKSVDTQQDMDETMYVSHKASTALGLPIVASITASSESRDQVRVKYSLTKKIQSDIDADGLAQCCKADASQCTKTIIGEFLLGTGDVLQSARDTDKASADVHVPKPLSANADYKSDDAWKKTTSFKDVYFAFLTEAAPMSLGSVAAAPNDCSWCDTLPGSLDGKYFCGVSPTVPEESAGRTLALRAAREQVVQYLGQTISVKSTTTSNALAKALDDHEVVKAASEGIASQVKDEKWCREKVPSPDGEMVRSKVLAFYPKSAEDAGRKAVTDAAADAGKKSGTMTPGEQKDVRDAAVKRK
jgi:hypothetical protein